MLSDWHKIHYVAARQIHMSGCYVCGMQSRFVSRTPAKFIWAGKSINDVVLKSDVVVNHFPKAKYFSSKVS